MPKIVVDEGAVPHICNGSDLMAPGIVRISGAFSKGALVAIVEQKFNKKIAIMRVLLDSSAMEATRRGKVAENIHYVGDRLWRVYKNFA
jgi:PUA domain protein